MRHALFLLTVGSLIFVVHPASLAKERRLSPIQIQTYKTLERSEDPQARIKKENYEKRFRALREQHALNARLMGCVDPRFRIPLDDLIERVFALEMREERELAQLSRVSRRKLDRRTVNGIVGLNGGFSGTIAVAKGSAVVRFALSESAKVGSRHWAAQGLRLGVGTLSTPIATALFFGSVGYLASELGMELNARASLTRYLSSIEPERARLEMELAIPAIELTGEPAEDGARILASIRSKSEVFDRARASISDRANPYYLNPDGTGFQPSLLSLKRIDFGQLEATRVLEHETLAQLGVTGMHYEYLSQLYLKLFEQCAEQPESKSAADPAVSEELRKHVAQPSVMERHSQSLERSAR